MQLKPIQNCVPGKTNIKCLFCILGDKLQIKIQIPTKKEAALINLMGMDFIFGSRAVRRRCGTLLICRFLVGRAAASGASAFVRPEVGLLWLGFGLQTRWLPEPRAGLQSESSRAARDFLIPWFFRIASCKTLIQRCFLSNSCVF